MFVVGCHRSGTNLLYDTLLSAGGFAVYRGYLPIYETLIPRFGSLANPHSRKKIVDTWMRSKGFARAGVEAAPLSSQLLSECRTGGDFIRIVMNRIAEKQGASRWAVYDPDNILYIPRIKRELPNALFVHIIRDGRDIALSLMKMEGFRPFPWSPKARGLLETALYWKWTVQTGRTHGNRIPADYIEVRYEDMIAEPRAALSRLSQFLDHDLDYDRIQNTGLGRLRDSNSSFLGDESQVKNPVNRWKEKLSGGEVAQLETIIGPSLKEFGYSLTLTPEQRQVGLAPRLLGSLYPGILSAKHWLKSATPAGRFADLSVLELRDPPSDSQE